MLLVAYPGEGQSKAESEKIKDRILLKVFWARISIFRCVFLK